MSKKHRYNDRFRQAAASAVEQPSHQQDTSHTPKIIGGVIFVSVLVGAWLLMKPAVTPTLSSPQASDDTLSVEQGGSANDASDASSDLLQGTGDQPLDGSSGAEIQNSVGGEAATNSSELLKQIEAGDVDITVEQSSDSDSNLKIE